MEFHVPAGNALVFRGPDGGWLDRPVISAQTRRVGTAVVAASGPGGDAAAPIL